MQRSTTPPLTPRHRTSAWLPWLIGGCSMLLTVLAALYVGSVARERDQLRFDSWVQHAQNDLEDRIETRVTLLRGVIGLFGASEYVTHGEFTAYIDCMHLADRYAGLRGIGYAPIVTAEQIPAFEARMRSEVDPGFHVWPAEQSSLACPITYVAPIDPQRPASLGFNLYTSEQRRHAMEAARDAGTAIMSHRVKTLQPQDEGRDTAFIIYMPVYATGTTPHTPEERRASITGYVFTGLRIQDIMDLVVQKSVAPYMHLSLYDGTFDAANLVYASVDAADGSPPHPLFTRVRNLTLAGRPLTLVFTSRREFEAGATSGVLTPMTLAGGTGFSLMLLITTWLEVRARRRTEVNAAALDRSRQELKQLNETLEQRVSERTLVAEQRARQLRALAFEMTQTEQRERRRLAQLLHDNLQQILVAASMRLDVAGRAAADPRCRKLVRESQELLRESVEISRSLAMQLSPPVLYDAGLVAALHWLARQMAEKHGLRVEVESSLQAEPRGDDINAFLFQSVRELLFNIAKHAHVGEARVILSQDNSHQVVIEVIDKGAGFDSAVLEKETSVDSFGLFSIRERLNQMGGTFTLTTSPGQGTRVVLCASYKPDDHDTGMEHADGDYEPAPLDSRL